MEVREHQVLTVHQGHQEVLAQVEVVVLQVVLEHQGLMVHQEHLVQVVRREALVALVPLVRQV